MTQLFDSYGAVVSTYLEAKDAVHARELHHVGEDALRFPRNRTRALPFELNESLQYLWIHATIVEESPKKMNARSSNGSGIVPMRHASIAMFELLHLDQRCNRRQTSQNLE